MDEQMEFWNQLYDMIKVDKSTDFPKKEMMWEKVKLHELKNSILLSSKDPNNLNSYIYILPYGSLIINEQRVEYFYVVVDDLSVDDINTVDAKVMSYEEIKNIYEVDVKLNDFRFIDKIADMVVDNLDTFVKLKKINKEKDFLKSAISHYLKNID